MNYIKIQGIPERRCRCRSRTKCWRQHTQRKGRYHFQRDDAVQTWIIYSDKSFRGEPLGNKCQLILLKSRHFSGNSLFSFTSRGWSVKTYFEQVFSNDFHGHVEHEL